MAKTLKTILARLATRFLPALLCTACSLNIPPMDLFSDPDAISNVENARSFLTSVYRDCPHAEPEFSILGNDFCPTSLSYNNVELTNLYSWREKEITKLAADLWMGYYHAIALCDALEERLPNVAAEKESEKQELRRIALETKVLKAWSYLQLLKIFAPAVDRGDDEMGVLLKSHLGIENKQRATISQCTAHVADLLKEVADTTLKPKSRQWMSDKAAGYLLADLYLYMGQYERVVERAAPLLAAMPTESGDRYEDAYRALWTDAEAGERIFAFYMDSPIFANLEFDSKLGDLYAVNPELAMPTTDRRYRMALVPRQMDGGEVLLLGKYNKLQKENKQAPYLNVMRRAGLVFMLAESYARLGDSQKAVATLNDYRRQTGKTPLAAETNGEALVDSVLHDKYVEFAGEGANFFDLKRTHRHPLPRLGVWGKSKSARIAPDDYRWAFPLPKAERRFNLANVRQNKGWYDAIEK